MLKYDTIKPLAKCLAGACEHETKVTRINNRWHCRVFLNGEVNQEVAVYQRSDIGPAIREMLRMEDKCGNISAMAGAARMRPTLKEAIRRAAVSIQYGAGEPDGGPPDRGK